MNLCSEKIKFQNEARRRRNGNENLWDTWLWERGKTSVSHLYQIANQGNSMSWLTYSDFVNQYSMHLWIFQGSFFCSQECFHGSWNLHKALHKLAKSGNPSSCSKPNRSYNPWPGYVFTGRLRPAEQSNKRVVPDHIPRPDYADHPEGYPLSEQKLRGNTYVKQLDDEEIENLRVACKLGKVIKICRYPKTSFG